MSSRQLLATFGGVQSSLEDQSETLKCMIKAQRQSRKERLMEQVLAQQFPNSIDHGDDNLCLSGSNSILTERLKQRLIEATCNGKKHDEEKSFQPVSCFQQPEDREATRSWDQEDQVDPRERPDPPQTLSKRAKFIKAGRQARQVLQTVNEPYDFFTFRFEPDPPCETEKNKIKAIESDKGDERYIKDRDAAIGKEDQNEERHQEKTDLFITTHLPQDLLQVKKAEYVGYRKCIQKERKLLYKPSAQTVPNSIKLPGNKKPRRLEEEGLCVGKRPPVSLANENILENRILKTKEGKKWFGDDGKILALPDPIKKSSTRSPLLHLEKDPDPELQAVYRKAVKSTKTGPCVPGAEELKADFQLDVDISSLVFSHHPLLSREHLLGARLTQLYDLYLTRQHNDLTGHLSDKLKGLRKAMQNMLGIESLTAAKQQRISDYSLEIRNTRQLRDSEQEKDRTLLQNLIEVWKEMKALRRFQKYTSTTYKLRYRRVTVDQEKDEREYEEEIMSEVLDVELELEEEYKKKLLNYKIQLQEFNAWRNKQESKKKQRKKKEGRLKENSGQEHEDQDKVESKETLEKVPPRPEAPERLVLGFLEKEVREKASRIRRKPGEAILIPVLYTSGSITATEFCPPAEKNRRNEVAKLSFFIRILYNNKEVSQTERRFLSSNFKLHFGKIFNLKVANFPRSINLQVFEDNGLWDTLLAQVLIPVPQPSVVTGQAHLKELEFSSSPGAMSDHKPEWSGRGQSPPTSGKLSCCASWGITEDGVPMAPPVARKPSGVHNYLDAVSHSSAPGLYNVHNPDQAARSQLDPNDPNYTSIMQILEVSKDGKVVKREYLGLEHFQEEFNFVSDEELDRSKRFRMLQLRNRGVPEFQNYKFIPALEHEVTNGMFREFDARLEEREITETKQYLDGDQAEAAKHLLRMRQRVTDKFNSVQHYGLPCDMGITEGRPETDILRINLFKLIKPKRQLKPERKERANITTQNLPHVNVKLLVNVIRGYNIPVRWTENSTHCFEDSEWSVNQVQVRPFVEVSFQDTVLQTSTAEGRNPSWNQQLQFPVSAPNGNYSALSLQSVSDEVFINVFDEVVHNVEVKDRQRGTSVQTQVEKHWLGLVKFPFSTICSQSRIDGMFKMNTPAVLLGYSKEEKQDSNGGNWFSSQSQEPYITLFITTEPVLVPVTYIKDQIDSEEEESLLQASKKFEKDASLLCPERPCITTVIDLAGREAFVTRYIRPLNPPEMLLVGLSPNSQYAMVARFVSLIPSLSDRDLFSASCELWSACDQFLTHLAGDKADHAVLLCNYFLFLNKKAWLIIGSAVPEGPTTYVLTYKDSQYLIWNPRSGQSYRQYDAFCPLQTVGSLVNGDNVWLNIQKHTSPTSISFDNMKADLWRPFFGPSAVSSRLPSIQPERLVYQQPNKAAAAELQRKIEKTIKDKFMEWRPHQPTHWNRYCISILKKFLPKLELSERQSIAERHCHELQKLLGDLRISGFSLHQPFSEMQHIVKAVHSTGVHKIQAPNVEFALAVHVHPYPNGVLSVWMYLASLMHV